MFFEKQIQNNEALRGGKDICCLMFAILCPFPANAGHKNAVGQKSGAPDCQSAAGLAISAFPLPLALFTAAFSAKGFSFKIAA